MHNYQILTLIGAIFGIVIVPIILLSMTLLVGFFSAFDPSVDAKALGQMTFVSIVFSIIVSIIAIVLVFVNKNTKTIGYVLLALGVVSLIATNISGIVTWVLFFVAGILAIKSKNEHENKANLRGFLRCEYCGTWFEKEVEKLNHYINCEKKKNYETNVR